MSFMAEHKYLFTEKNAKFEVIGKMIKVDVGDQNQQYLPLYMILLLI